MILSGGSILASRLSMAQVQKTPNVKPGVWPVMYSPFTESRAVDYNAVKEMTEFYVATKVSGIFAAALSGEVFVLSFDEALEIGRQTVRQADGRIGVVVGANVGSSIEEQAANLARMQEIGVDAAVILLSRLPSADDIEGQLIKLMELTKGPLGIYECPAPDHRQVTVQTVRRIAQTGRFHFIKETSRDAEVCGAKAQAAKGTPLRVFSATLSILPKALDLGADGHCGTVANICPELTKIMCETKDNAERERVYKSLEAINSIVVNDAYPSSGKYLLQKRGLHLTPVSRSGNMGEFTEDVRKALDEFLKHFDFQRGLIPEQ